MCWAAAATLEDVAAGVPTAIQRLPRASKPLAANASLKGHRAATVKDAPEQDRVPQITPKGRAPRPKRRAPRRKRSKRGAKDILFR